MIEIVGVQKLFSTNVKALISGEKKTNRVSEML